MTSDKIISREQMAELSAQFQSDGKRVVLCHGTFDLMHTGHIRYLQRASLEGQVLFVTVTADGFVNKGPERPIFNHQLRAENLAALECVNYVAVNEDVSAVELLELVKPNVYVKGGEYRSHGEDVTGNIIHEENTVRAYGGEVFYTDEITFSSTSLLNEHFGVFPPKTKAFLKRFSEAYSPKTIFDYLDSVVDTRILVAGDAIIDQYHYVVPLGQTGKDNVLSVAYDTEEQFAGGSIAIANHIATCAEAVTLASALGDYDSHEDFIRKKLGENVDPIFAYYENSPTVTKRRFVDSDMSKLFEVYFYHDEPKLKDDGSAILGWLRENADKFDLVIAADFGNGFITDEMVSILCEKAKFLAVNTQVNSGNRGYHVINRYSRADFISLNEPELRLAAHNRHSPLEEIGKDIVEQLSASYLAITRGINGVLMYDRGKNEFNAVPALSSRVVDRVGAGDAFLSFASLMLSKGLGVDVAGFLGAVAAAIDVQIVCNREPVTPVAVKKYVTTLLK